MTIPLSDRQKYRLLEMLPGVFVWGTFIAMFVVSFARPLWAMTFIILFDTYWLFRILYWLIYLFGSYKKFRHAIRVDWRAKIDALPESHEIYHAIFLPTVQEPYEVIQTTFESLKKSSFPNERMIVVYALEERTKEHALPIAERLAKEYDGVFRKILITIHPQDVPGEVKGKGANIAYAGRRFQEYVDTELKVPYEQILVSSFDVDTCVHPQYFSYLTNVFLTTPNRLRTSYQPVPLFNNNIWDAPALMRVASMGTTFWLMTEQLRPERLFTFSSHSMSFRALVDVGFWQDDIVTEDSRIFLQCFLEYDGDYTITPLFLPVSMDTVLGDSLWESFQNLYKQQRRWAWGSEHIPYMLWNFPRAKTIPWKRRWHYIWTIWEGMYSWATAPLVLFVMGRLPLLAAGSEIQRTAVFQSTPFILQILMFLAMAGMASIALMSLTIIPPRPRYSSQYTHVVMLFQWLLLPISMVLFGSFPAIESQTRLMLGKYLGFHVTKKVRKHANV
ncbi:MAG: glycosyltransferase family 2 protein [Candidatus Kerfeldbacteria bacterium]|nr:glycosyltransferase family 2 protein [Candidatus Kerfeldbacteria bacterium]